MNFHRTASENAPEINLIPLIDVLLVIIVFLTMSTTFIQAGGLEIALPTADTEAATTQSAEIIVAITASGDIVVNGRKLGDKSIELITSALASVRPARGTDPVVVISADAQAAHQNVINVMQAAQRAGLPRVTFATRVESSKR
jgi:biopolymer transport protein ExbD